MPQRSNRIVVVAHCLLNVNTKVHGLADYRGVHTGAVMEPIAEGVGIVQLPCPEITYLGMRRWGMTREQYDIPSFRRHCERILEPVVDTLVALSADGCELVELIGVDGSPSCGVGRTCEGYGGGEIEALLRKGEAPESIDARRPGVFVEVFRSLLEAVGLKMPFRGVDEAPCGCTT